VISTREKAKRTKTRQRSEGTWLLNLVNSSSISRQRPFSFSLSPLHTPLICHIPLSKWLLSLVRSSPEVTLPLLPSRSVIIATFLQYKSRSFNSCVPRSSCSSTASCPDHLLDRNLRYLRLPCCRQEVPEGVGQRQHWFAEYREEVEGGPEARQLLE
jgi:hypothetical protein